MRLWKLVVPTIAAALIAAAAYGSLFDWSKTPASNTTLEGIGWSNSMAPTSLDDGVRAIAAALKKFQEDVGGQPTSAGTDTITLTTNSVVTSYTDGMLVGFTAGGTNTGAATFNADGVGGQDLKKYTSAGLVALAAGDVTLGGRYLVTYEVTGADWILLNPATAPNAILNSLLTTRGDLIRRGASAPERVALGTTGQVLASDGTDAVWAAGVNSLLTTRGDLIRRGASAGERVALGASGLVLKSDGTDAVWGNPVEAFCVAASDEVTTIVTGNDKIHWRMPYAFTVTGIRGTLTGPSTSGTFTADVHEGGTTIMATNKLVFDQSEETTTTAATAPVVSDTSLADDAEMSIDVDDDGTSAEGLKVCLIGIRS